MFRPSTNDITRKVKRLRPRAGRMSVSRALKSLEAQGLVVDEGDEAKVWTLP
jgi:Fe2+ or Zn2+ uptake regulation protein